MAQACRTFGVHRSTFYRWKRRVERHGLEILRPRERRRPKMPNALPAMVEERVLSFAIAHPGLGPRRVASELAGRGGVPWSSAEGGATGPPNKRSRKLRRVWSRCAGHCLTR